MAKLQIIGIPQSTYVRTSRLTAHEKGVDYDLVVEPPHSAAVSAIHPFGKVPAMRHGDLELFESNAINNYIDRSFDGPALVPADAAGAAKVDQWVSVVNTVMDPLIVRRYLFAYIFPQGADGKPDRAAIDACLDDLDKQVGVLDGALGKSEYLAGEKLTLADLNLLPIVHYMLATPEAGEKVRNAGNLSGWFARMSERDSVKATIPPPPSS
jgi:glutathione S-transferase